LEFCPRLSALSGFGDTILDIGANIGTVTIPLAANGAGNIAYEALPEYVRFLEAAGHANRLENRVTSRNVAVWERTVRLSFTGDSAWARVIPGQEGTHEAEAIDVDLPLRTKITAIKLDVEGSELHVLRGMRRLLASQGPHIIFESNNLELGRLGSSAAMIFDIMKQYGYRIYRIYDKRRLLRPGMPAQECNVADFLATRFGAWRLRVQAGVCVGSMQDRHMVRRIVEWGHDHWSDQLHLLEVADRLPVGAIADHRVASRIAIIRERHRNHLLFETVRQGHFRRLSSTPRIKRRLNAGAHSG
jgi:FkbM family methyltransferase